MKLSEENQPMREASLIELIETLPKSHSARVEYTKLLGRLSHEKNERLEMQQRIDELEKENTQLKDLQQKYVWITREEMKEYSDIHQALMGQSLAQHDKEVVRRFVNSVGKWWELESTKEKQFVVYENDIDTYLEQLQEQE